MPANPVEGTAIALSDSAVTDPGIRDTFDPLVYTLERHQGRRELLHAPRHDLVTTAHDFTFTPTDNGSYARHPEGR